MEALRICDLLGSTEEKWIVTVSLDSESIRRIILRELPGTHLGVRESAFRNELERRALCQSPRAAVGALATAGARGRICVGSRLTLDEVAILFATETRRTISLKDQGRRRMVLRNERGRALPL